MLLSEDFIDYGKEFPPFSETQRLRKYRDNKLLFEGKHNYVFNRWTRVSGFEELSVIVNWNRRLSLLWADMLFGNQPRITAENQESLDGIINRNNLYRVLYECAIDVSRYGVGIPKIRIEDGKALIETVPADIWFPVVNPKNKKDITAHVLAWKYKDADDNSFLNVEIHRKGSIEYRTYSMARDTSIRTLLQQETENTGYDGFLVFPIYNVSTSDDVYGDDDYTDVNPILEEIEMRLTQVSRVLDKHADPKMYGDESALEYNERTGEYVVRGGGDFFPVSDDTVKPGYITWDANLDDAQKQIEALMKQFYIVTNTSPAAFGQLEQGLAESGSALKRLMMATIMKANRMKNSFYFVIKDLLSVASELERRNGTPYIGDVSIEFVSSLPEDETEKVRNEAERYRTGLTSLQSSIERLDGLTGENLQEELNAINLEGNDNE